MAGLQPHSGTAPSIDGTGVGSGGDENESDGRIGSSSGNTDDRLPLSSK